VLTAFSSSRRRGDDADADVAARRDDDDDDDDAAPPAPGIRGGRASARDADARDVIASRLAAGCVSSARSRVTPISSIPN
jgi:hypothetical protein